MSAGVGGRCGSCRHWRKLKFSGDAWPLGRCRNSAARIRAVRKVGSGKNGHCELMDHTYCDFGCPFWSAQPVVSDVGEERRTLEYTSDGSSLAAMLGGAALRR